MKRATNNKKNNGSNFTMLPFKNPEVRKEYFLESFGRPVEEMAIFSFGACNYNCPYCKRDGQFKGEGNQILRAQDYAWADVRAHVDRAIASGQRIRLSGGDPCTLPRQALQIAEYVWECYGEKISIAHNGSSPQLAKTLLPYLEYAAIDLKGSTDASLAYRAGLTFKEGRIERTLDVIRALTKAGVLVDVRTCVFGDTLLEELAVIRSLLLGIYEGKGKIFWTLRKYNEIASCNFIPGDARKIQEFAEKLATPELSVGFRDKWTGATFNIF
ncbi:radical SAM protein [Candidatus Saccharibacteria bacterium]|nr:radical SAM protein [Candidatus Saccharibacteria bacterium]